MKQVILAFCSLIIAMHCNAQITLPSIFSDNMVLQQKTDVNIWGMSRPEENIKIKTSWSSKVYATTADSCGKWSIYIKTPRHSVNHSIEIFTLTDKKSIRNILIGEVWLCSGQSNMEFEVLPSKEQSWMTGMEGAQAELEDSNYPYLHFFKVEEGWDYYTPQKDCKGEWVVCNAEYAKTYSAIAFLFGKYLHKSLNVPVGIILSAYGGTHAESWTRQEVMQNNPLYKNVLEKYTPQAMEPKGYNHKVPSSIWNYMVNPIVGYTIKGNIWYQAESNAFRAKDYPAVFENMVNDWRKQWGQKRLPFYFMQVAPHSTQPAKLRETQAQCWLDGNLKDIGMATVIDAGDSLDLHPKNKILPAKRYLAWALNREYGKNVECCGPLYESYKLEGNKVEITFKYAKGLYIKDNEVVNDLYIAGEDGKLYPALAIIENGKLKVWSKNVSRPKLITYCCSNYCKGNIYNSAQLPAYPFRIEIN